MARFLKVLCLNFVFMFYFFTESFFFLCNIRFAASLQDGNNYFILLIVTDGIITDMPQTTEAIVCVRILISFSKYIFNLFNIVLLFYQKKFQSVSFPYYFSPAFHWPQTVSSKRFVVYSFY